MEEAIEQALTLLGLHKNQRKLYLDVLKHGKSSALDIAKRTSIHRTNVYDTLRELGDKGFILEIVEENKRLFMARNPDKIKSYLAQVSHEVEAIIPHLKEMATPHEEETSESVSMSKGTFALRDALESLLAFQAPIMSEGASIESVELYEDDFLAHFHKKRIEKKILMRHIYNQDAAERISFLNKLKYTEALYLPKRFDATVTTLVCSDTVLLLIFTDPSSVIIIKNKKIADSYAKYFEILWARSSL